MLTRREFMGVTATVGGSIMANTSSFSNPMERELTQQGKSECLVFATNWGFSGSWDTFCEKISQAGYDGTEAWYPADPKERDAFLQAIDKHKLKYGLLIGSGESDYKRHLQQFQSSLEGAASMKPIYINCHSGRDYFTFEQNRALIDLTIQKSRVTSIPIYHETHRSRILYSAPVARQYAEAIPELKITLDISHWCAVHESLLADQPQNIAMALNRTGHIHARIGHPEGPQVNDPRAPEWKNAVEAHFQWWDQVVQRKKRDGEQITFLTEFGPVDYMPAMPYTRQPLANQWEINLFMMHSIRTRYSK